MFRGRDVDENDPSSLTKDSNLVIIPLSGILYNIHFHSCLNLIQKDE